MKKPLILLEFEFCWPPLSNYIKIKLYAYVISYIISFFKTVITAITSYVLSGAAVSFIYPSST